MLRGGARSDREILAGCSWKTPSAPYCWLPVTLKLTISVTVKSNGTRGPRSSSCSPTARRIRSGEMRLGSVSEWRTWCPTTILTAGSASLSTWQRLLSWSSKKDTRRGLWSRRKSLTTERGSHNMMMILVSGVPRLLIRWSAPASKASIIRAPSPEIVPALTSTTGVCPKISSHVVVVVLHIILLFSANKTSPVS